ncbi:MAG: fluoride efflux transporter FluC [Halobacteriota archaeon]
MKTAAAGASVAVGGALGSVSRYAVESTVAGPPSTYFVNVVGCYALGVLLAGYGFDAVGERARLLVGVGFLSSFTTYSAFAFDVWTLAPSAAAVYVASTYAAGFAATALGVATMEARYA